MGEAHLTLREKSIDRVLAAVQIRFGLSTVRDLPWIRDRVAAFLDAYAERAGCPADDAADLVIEDDASMNDLIGSLRVGETRFFREAQQLEAAVQHICASTPPGATISALSAGCSTGEEAYTLGILLADRSRKFEILGVDRSEEAIETARQGRYTYESAREVPRVLVRRYFEDDGTMLTVRPSIRAHVSFDVYDLMESVPGGPFRIILFKNVLIYLANYVGAHVASRLASELNEDGILLSAASEVVRLSSNFDTVRLSRGIIALRPRRRR
jgi:chemotaxis protein methyltransferase CheR